MGEGGLKAGLFALVLLLLAGAAVRCLVRAPAGGDAGASAGAPAAEAAASGELARPRTVARATPPRFVVPAAPPAGPPPPATEAAARAEVVPPDRLYDLTRAELTALAGNCELRIDLPGITSEGDRPLRWWSSADVERLGLPANEQAVVERALLAYKMAVNGEFRRFFHAATGGEATAFDFFDQFDETNPHMQRIAAVLAPRDFSQGARRVAEELAGLRPLAAPGAPADGERTVALTADHYRRVLRLGDELEGILARELGPDRARDLRRNHLSGRTRRAGCL